MLRAYCFLGVIEAALSMGAFFLVWRSHGYGLAELQAVSPVILSHAADAATIGIYAQATTLTLAVIVACQDGNVFACRSERTSIRSIGFFSNPLIWLGIAVEWILIISITQQASLQQIFSTAPIVGWHWLVLLLCPPIMLGADEMRKVVVHRLSQTPRQNVI